MEEKLRELHKQIYRFFRDNDDISSEDMSKFLKSEFAEFKNTKEHYNRVQQSIGNSNVSEETKQKVDEFWHSLVQQTIDFINNNEDVKTMLTERQATIDKEWNGEKTETDDFRMIPDISMHFGIDGLDSSLEHGKWNAGTDSYLTLGVGNEPVISCN